MGEIKKTLISSKLPDRLPHNGRMFIDLCENIHIHYRELRIVFSINEFLEFADIFKRSVEDVRNYLIQNPDYKEQQLKDTIIIAGGNCMQSSYLKNSPQPTQSKYFNNDFSIELQDKNVRDEINVHWRDYRIALPREHLKIIADLFSKAKEHLIEFEKLNPQYTFKKTIEVNEKNNFKASIQGEQLIEISKIKTRFKDNIIPDHITFNLSFFSQLKHQYATNEYVIPIVLSTESNGENHIIDGNHRFFAARESNKDKINCIITDITFDESFELRRVEGMLKDFDKKTNYKYNVSDFNKTYFAYKANKFYSDNFYKTVFKKNLIEKIQHKYL